MANITFSKSSGLNNSVYGQSYEPIKMMIEKKAEAFEKQSILPKIYNMDTSSSFAEKITSMTSMDGFKPVDEGAAFPAESWQEGYSKTLTHVTFKSEFTITEEMLDDSKIINLRKKPTAFITGYMRMRELFGSNLLTGATGESITFRGQTFSTTCNDGLPLFHTAHTSITDASATQSNMYSNEFSADGLGLVETAMQNYTDDKGNILGVVPDTIVIPNKMSLKKAVFACIEQRFQLSVRQMERHRRSLLAARRGHQSVDRSVLAVQRRQHRRGLVRQKAAHAQSGRRSRDVEHGLERKSEIFRGLQRLARVRDRRHRERHGTEIRR